MEHLQQHPEEQKTQPAEPSRFLTDPQTVPIMKWQLREVIVFQNGLLYEKIERTMRLLWKNNSGIDELL